MPQSPLRTARFAASLFALAAATAYGQAPANVQNKLLYDATLRVQMAAAMHEKATRTPGMRKLDTALVYTLRAAKGQDLRKDLPKLRLPQLAQTDGTVSFELHGAITPNLVAQLKNLGATITSSTPRFNALSARMPILKLESAALLPGVKSLQRPSQFVRNAGSVQSEGDRSMRTNELFNAYGLSGVGVAVSTISDSDKYREQSQASGDLPTGSGVLILSGRSGRKADNSDSGEGTAMMEIIHDVAPGSPLAFSTTAANATDPGSQETMAQNYLDLYNAGCDVLCDDIIFLNEPAFQDGPISHAIDLIWAAGGVSFSSAGNQGNTLNQTSGVWEGDFKDSGQTFDAGDGGGAKPAAAWFSSNNDPFNQALTGGPVSLQWNDKLGGATADYDVYSTDGFGNILDAGNTNNIGGDPIEFFNNNAQGGEYIFAVRYTNGTAANRVLRLSIFKGKMGYVTGGQIFGHMAGDKCVGVAAIKAETSPQRPFNASDVAEDFSSDGLRRIYYAYDGTQLATNLTRAGALVRQQPILSAPDGVSTTLPLNGGLNPFFGTSAAAPHAAALAALLREFAPDATPTLVVAAMKASCIDILTAGYDVTSGAGAVNGVAAIKYLLQTKTQGVSPATSTFAGNGNVSLTLNLGRKAPPAGLTVAITATGDTSKFSGPASITIPAGASTKSFTVGANGTGTGTLNLTLTEAYSGAALGTATVNRTADAGPTVSTVTLDPAEVVGASRNVAGKVTLSTNATASYTVELNSTNTAVATVPATAVISSGQNFKTFVVTSKAVATDTTVTIRARKQGTTAWTNATLTVRAPKPNSCVPNPTSGLPGTSVTFTIKLDGPAPTGGITAGLVTTDANVIAVPRTITIAAGQTTKTFTTTAGPSPIKKTVTVSVRYNSATVAQGRFAILVPEVSALTLSPSTVKGGANSTGRVTLASAAPAGGITVKLSKSGTGATIPATVTVAAGQTSKTFTVTTTATTTTKTFKIVAKTATVQKTAILTITK